MRIIDIAFNDIAQILRDKKSLLFLLLMPVAFTAFMGFAFNQANGAAEALPGLGWIDPNPEGFISQALIEEIEATGAFRVELFSSEETSQAEEQVRLGELAGLVIVPPDFNQVFLTKEDSTFTVVVDETGLAGQIVQQAVKTAWSRVRSALAIAGMSFDAMNGSGDARFDRADAFRSAFDTAIRQWDEPSLAVVNQPAQADNTDGASMAASGFNQSSPGMMVQFAIFGLTTSAGILVQERKSGTLGRMMSTSLPRASVIAGHLLALFSIVFAQGIILIVFGQTVFNVNYMAEPLGVLLVLISLALWTASLGLLIGLLAVVEDQVILFAMIAMFIVSALGGAWFPLEGTGPAFAKIGHLTPGAWAMDGFQNILLRGLGFDSVLLPVAVSLGYALLFFGLALWRFRRRECR